ncbi:hypothetical protein ACGFNY_44710 [Streptomyces chartreusis]|uniref:hypothetical protein n=1 Tax=Streptomyces chartreusis TaxID=1969 RepID=UPI0037194217
MASTDEHAAEQDGEGVPASAAGLPSVLEDRLDPIAGRRGVRLIGPGIQDLFRIDDAVGEAVTANLKPRATASLAVTERAHAAFSSFTPSGLSAAERARHGYLGPGDDLMEAMRALITAATDDMTSDEAKRSVRITLGPEFNKIMSKKSGRKGVLGTVDLGKLVEFITSRSSTGELTRDLPLAACSAEGEAERRLRQIEGVEDPAQEARVERDIAVSHDRTGRADREIDGDASQLVGDQVGRQMHHASAPEEQVTFPQRNDDDAHTASIQSFELRDGPSDVTAYHDFSSLRIAFEHVWTEIFDTELAALGRELYQEYVRLKIFTGVDDGDDTAINTLDDLRHLIDEVRTLSRMSNTDLPSTLKPSHTVPDAGTGAADLSDMVKVALDPMNAVTGAIKDDTVRAFVDPAGALFDAVTRAFAGKAQLTWGAFPGPLPSGDQIQVTVEDNVMEPGSVAIVIANTRATSWWKGLDFQEIDSAGSVVAHSRISTDPKDTDVWDRGSHNTLRLRTGQLRGGLLEFKKAAFLGVPTGFYVLTGLDQGIKDRARVTFTWVKD